MSVIINAAMPWFIITLSFMTTLALHGNPLSKRFSRIPPNYENPDLHALQQPGHIYH